MNPKHIDEVPEFIKDDKGKDIPRRAVAPYNFVELPNKVVVAEELPSGDRYYPDRHTGKIECTLTTESLLYTRCGWNPDDFAKYSEPPTHKTKEEKERWEKEEKAKWERERREIIAHFFSSPGSSLAAIPGSSIRGMLRTLVEIVSFGKIDRVSDQQHFFFRAVAAEADDPLKEEYKKYIKPKNIKAGYLVNRQDKWLIRPAMPIDQEPFVWVKEDRLRSISGFIPMRNLPEYRPQYFINISFQDIYTKNTRRFAGEVSSNCTTYQYKGVVVTSGNMLEGGTNPRDLKRQNHCIVREPNPDAQPIPISEDAIWDYCSALTPFQKQEPPFDENKGVFKNGRCIFYCQPEPGQPVTLFGQSPNFRIPYSPQGNGKASTARDFIPDFLKDSKDKPAITDVAEAIFGFVRRNQQPEETEQSRVGRVFVSDGILKSNQEKQVQASQEKTPVKILLSSPKPTTFQHYLVQKVADKSQLKHYASQPPSDTKPGKTVIRGHKLYWHKPARIEVPSDASDTQTSLIKPIDSGIEFTFTIHFENLSQVELGALLWVLSLSSEKSQTLETGKSDEKYCFSLGMGKPLGMGAVKIDYELHLSDRTERYKNLFDGNLWHTGKQNNTKEADCVKAFENFILDQNKGISEDDHPNGRRANSLKEVPRIEMLLAMLRCDPKLDEEQTRYMTIDKKDYVNRPVLPTPLQVMGISDNRRPSFSASSSANGKAVITSKPATQNQESARQTEISKLVQKQQLKEGQITEAKVTNKKEQGKQVTYEIIATSQKLSPKEPKKYETLSIGQIVKVKIVGLREDGSIKSIKCVD
ncbi:MAG TPA: TIGR03986 family CRISPR-associated RAMP protein [Cyanobacteria bacterium UBA8553]|nr:TIGR03986 family CRISPR-associated RAMP protein [Cyanobacteria bacterium UBA8553]